MAFAGEISLAKTRKEDSMARVNNKEELLHALTHKETAKEDEIARLVMTIPGTGYYSALLIISEVGDINGFRGCYHLCSYTGLVPHNAGGV